jgi:hypothetical protein
MDMYEIDASVYGHSSKAKAISEEWMNDSVEQHFFGHVAARSLVAGVKLLAEEITHTFGRVFEYLSNIDAFPSLLRGTDQQTVDHFCFLATIRY